MQDDFFKNILENLPIPLCVCDTEGVLLFSNKEFKKNVDISTLLNSSEIKQKYAENITVQQISGYEILILQNSNNAHSDFISTVSHELRTPLTSIRGFADTMLMSADKLSKEQTTKFLTIIRNQADRLTRLVENLLEISNITQTNKMILKEINLENILAPLIEIFRKKYPSQKYQVQIQSNLPNLWADSDMLEQILTNLIDNASKYSLDNSLIIIKALFLNNNIEIEIIDNAQKIPENQLKNIFKKFSRIDNPLTRKVEGSGLGLFISKTLTEKMNGEIFAKNNENGNSFILRLPVYSVEKHLGEKISEENS